MTGKDKILYVFGILMMLVYWGMAFLLIWSPLFTDRVPPFFRYALGIIFFIYGGFRAYRQIRRGKY